MDCFDDFTLYSYAHFENAQNIGWHIPKHECGDADNQTTELLSRFLDYRVNTTRGAGTIKKYTYNGKEYFLGCAEFRIISKEGHVYAIPDSVIQMVQQGSYRLPSTVMNSLSDGYLPGTEYYSNFITRYNPDCFWGASDQYIEAGKKAKDIVASNMISNIESMLDAAPETLDVITDEGSLLHVAIKHKAEDAAFFLIEKNIKLNRYNGGELFAAIDYGMDMIAFRLIDLDIPMQNYSPQNNPLFYSIMKRSNSIAKKLVDEQKSLFQTYDTPFVRNCNVLQWCARCGNIEMLKYLSSCFLA